MVDGVDQPSDPSVPGYAAEWPEAAWLVLDDVYGELHRAVDKHGWEQTPMNPAKSLADSFIILAEEFGEVARALTHDEGDPDKLRDELTQTAAMAVAMVVAMVLQGTV